MRAGGHQVEDGRHVAAKTVPIVKRQFRADAAGNRKEMDDGICRTADRPIDADGIGKGLPGQDLRRAQVLGHHLDDPAAGQPRQPGAVRINSRVSSVSGSANPRASAIDAMVEAVSIVMQ